MSEPETKPQAFVVVPVPSPSPAHAAWRARIERWLAEFENSLPEGNGEPLALGVILLAADHLWDRQHEQADFAQFNVHELVERCGALLHGPKVARNLGDTLSAFYRFLASTGRIDPDTASIIAAECRACSRELEVVS